MSKEGPGATVIIETEEEREPEQDSGQVNARNVLALGMIASEGSIVSAIRTGGGVRPGAGKPYKAIQLVRMTIEEARLEAEEALGFIIGVMRDEKVFLELRVDCAKEIMNRVWGKPRQRTEIDVPEPIHFTLDI